MSITIPKGKVPEDKILTYIVSETIRRELPKEFENVDPKTKNIARITHDITSRILLVLNEELIAKDFKWSNGSPAAHFRSTVAEKVETAFAKIHPEFNTYFALLKNDKSETPKIKNKLNV